MTTRMRRIAIAAVSLLGAAAATRAGTPPKPSRWEKTIQHIEARDKKSPPPKGEILLCGSSSARGWNVQKYFPNLKVTNRGFGGSQVHDSTQFADRIILPFQPRIILLYAGDNDIASGKAPELVFENFKLFVAKIHAALPKTKIVYIAIKPSTARWRMVEKMRAANRLIADHTKTDERLAYVDIDTPMIGKDGKPRAELLAKDGLHLSPAGYELWTSLVMPHLTSK